MYYNVLQYNINVVLLPLSVYTNTDKSIMFISNLKIHYRYHIYYLPSCKGSSKSCYYDEDADHYDDMAVFDSFDNSTKISKIIKCSGIVWIVLE